MKIRKEVISHLDSGYWLNLQHCQPGCSPCQSLWRKMIADGLICEYFHEIPPLEPPSHQSLLVLFSQCSVCVFLSVPILSYR